MKYAHYIFLVLTSYTAMAQKTTPKSAFLEKWDNSKQYLVEIAESMPEELYGYKPTEREMDFANQLIHICSNMRWLSSSYFSKENFNKKEFATNAPKTKKEICTLLKESFDITYTRVKNSEESDLLEIVDFFAGKKSKLQILNLLQDHVTHHRGQLIVYLNLNQVKPPRYIGW